MCAHLPTPRLRSGERHVLSSVVEPWDTELAASSAGPLSSCSRLHIPSSKTSVPSCGSGMHFTITVKKRTPKQNHSAHNPVRGRVGAWAEGLGTQAGSYSWEAYAHQTQQCSAPHHAASTCTHPAQQPVLPPAIGRSKRFQASGLRQGPATERGVGSCHVNPRRGRS